MHQCLYAFYRPGNSTNVSLVRIRPIRKFVFFFPSVKIGRALRVYDSFPVRRVRSFPVRRFGFVQPEIVYFPYRASLQLFQWCVTGSFRSLCTTFVSRSTRQFVLRIVFGAFWSRYYVIVTFALSPSTRKTPMIIANNENLPPEFVNFDVSSRCVYYFHL